MNRRLTLKAEHLTELGAGDLAQVAGGALPTLDGCIAAPTQAICEALSLTCLTGYYPSINAPCTTN